MATYKCRIRFMVPPNFSIIFDRPEVPLDLSGDTPQWRLRSYDKSQRISDSRDLVLIGGPFAARRVALEKGRRMQFALRLCGAKLNVGFDLGRDRPHGGTFMKPVLKSLSRRSRGNVLNDIHGLVVIQGEKPNYFLSGKADVISGRSGDRFTDELRNQFGSLKRPSAKKHLALDLYAASFFEQSDRARLLTLVTAVEILGRRARRTKHAQQLISQFELLVKHSKLSETEKRSLEGGISRLEFRPPAQDIARLIKAHLAGRTYMGLSADKFYKDVTRLRGRLIHRGEYDDNLGAVAATFQNMVGDLLVAVSTTI